MKAIAVHPGKPNSMHLEDVPEPQVSEIPDGRGVKVRVLRVGVDGTDKEINAAEYGAAPEGYDYLITGHEGLGRVVEVGPNVPTTIRPGTLVVSTVRRPGRSLYDEIGLQDMTTDDVYYERGINLRHGYLAEFYVEDAQYVVPLPDSLSEVGVLLEPLTVAEKAIHQAFVLGNKVMVGSVNASPEDFASGRDDLVKAQAFYPGWLDKLLTTPVGGLENYEQMVRELTENSDAIKVFVEVESSSG